MHGADGISFVMQESSNTLDRTGGGAGIGYSVGTNQNNGFNTSIAIEFDTHPNSSESDPANDHMGIQLDGITDHNIVVNALISPVDLGNIETGNDYYHVFLGIPILITT